MAKVFDSDHGGPSSYFLRDALANLEARFYQTQLKIIEAIASRDYPITDDELEVRAMLLKAGPKSGFELTVLMTLNTRLKRSLRVAFMNW